MMLWTAPPLRIECYSSCVESESNRGGETAANLAAEALKELARTRRRNADKVVPGIGTTRLGQRTLKCVFSIGTRSAQSIMASGLTAAQTGRTHDRTRPMLQLRQKVLARAPSTRDPMYGPAVRRKRFCRSGGNGLASMYPASDWSVSCSGPSWISARVRSH